MSASKMTVAARGDRELLITRTFDAPRELVFDAHTQPELVKRWLLGPDGWTMPVCEIDFRVGGKFRYVWRNADGRDMGMGGVYREIVRPEKLVHSEKFDDDWTGGEAITSMTFAEKHGRTEMTMVVQYSSREARDTVLKSPMADGMEMGYARLDRLVEASRAVS